MSDCWAYICAEWHFSVETKTLLQPSHGINFLPVKIFNCFSFLSSLFELHRKFWLYWQFIFLLRLQQIIISPYKLYISHLIIANVMYFSNTMFCFKIKVKFMLHTFSRLFYCYRKCLCNFATFATKFF